LHILSLLLFLDNGSEKKEANLIHIVNLLLDSFRQYRKMDFKPSTTLVQSLEDMGFEKPKILETLKITGNNQANAVSKIIHRDIRIIIIYAVI
jgi:hypothetical protein